MALNILNFRRTLPTPLIFPRLRRFTSISNLTTILSAPLTSGLTMTALPATLLSACAIQATICLAQKQQRFLKLKKFGAARNFILISTSRLASIALKLIKSKWSVRFQNCGLITKAKPNWRSTAEALILTRESVRLIWIQRNKIFISNSRFMKTMTIWRRLFPIFLWPLLQTKFKSALTPMNPLIIKPNSLRLI